jgi:hypothetical protein
VEYWEQRQSVKIAKFKGRTIFCPDLEGTGHIQLPVPCRQ